MNQQLLKAQTIQKPNVLAARVMFTLGLAGFCALFILLDNAYYQFMNARFPSVGTSAWLATLWGIVSRAHLWIVLIPLAAWRPRFFGFQIGQVARHWRMLLIMLLANCGVIAAYLWFTRGTTPYSNDIWAITEIITVPLVEETFWRGLVFGIMVTLLTQMYPQTTGNTLAVWVSGIVFGLMHGNNIFSGVPILFVAIQVVNATIWGVVYSYARSKTESIYPAIALHAAMNLVVILF